MPASAVSRAYRPSSLAAILAPMGEIDPQGTRRDGLDAFLDQKVEEGYVIETRSDTHAIIFRRPKGLKRFARGQDPGRYVVRGRRRWNRDDASCGAATHMRRNVSRQSPMAILGHS